MVRLVDFISEVEEDVEFGTCELCFRTSDLHREFFVFKDDEGRELEIETGGWSWGDYDIYYPIDNIPDFAHFINKKNILSLQWLEDNFDEMYYEYMEERED